MGYREILKEASRIVHRNWPLIAIQLASVVISFMSFFMIVGIPIAVAFILFGLDLTEILRQKDLLSAFKGSTEFLSKYFGLALLILFSIFASLLFTIALWVVTISGTIGVLAKAITGEMARFTMRTFYKEGKRLFFRVLFFFLMVGIMFIALTVILGLILGSASAVIEMIGGQGATLNRFLHTFLFLLFISIGILTISVTVYGTAHMVFYREGAWESLKKTFVFLYEKPSAVGFYTVLLVGYIVIGLLVILLGSPLAMIPVVGPILSLPYQVVMYVLQAYISLIMLASAFYYYYKIEYVPHTPVPCKEVSEQNLTLPEPTQDPGISSSSTDAPPQAPQGSAGPQQK